jgi:amidophosphoribosyltransferase
MNHKEDCLFALSYLKKEFAESGNTSVAYKRIQMGKELARVASVDAEIIVPIPETGILFAQGYALESGIPFAHAILKKRPKIKTLFIDERKKTFNDIIFIVPELLRGKKLILIDETVISGLSLSLILEKIKNVGPKEIHVRLATPPIHKECPSNSFSESWEFINGRDYKNFFGVDSFEYPSLDSLEKYATCTYCFGGEKDESKVVGI